MHPRAAPGDQADLTLFESWEYPHSFSMLPTRQSGSSSTRFPPPSEDDDGQTNNGKHMSEYPPEAVLRSGEVVHAEEARGGGTYKYVGNRFHEQRDCLSLLCTLFVFL